MAIDDIEGAKPKKEEKKATRDNYSCNDIEGAGPKKQFVRKTVHD